PLEMVETFVNFRPRELWPRRALAFDDASQRTRSILGVLEQRGYVQESAADERDALINDAAMGALTKFDEVMRDLALQRYREFERELMPVMTRFVVEDTVRRFHEADLLRWPAGVDEQAEIDQLVDDLAAMYGAWLSRTPALEDVTKLTLAVAQRLSDRQALTVAPATALELRAVPPLRVFDALAESLGAERKPFAGEVLKAMEKRQREL